MSKTNPLYSYTIHSLYVGLRYGHIKNGAKHSGRNAIDAWNHQSAAY